MDERWWTDSSLYVLNHLVYASLDINDKVKIEGIRANG